MTKYYKATAPDGRVYLRATASERIYTHTNGSSWAGRLDLAQRLRQPIFPAVEITAQEYRALYKAQQPERDAWKAEAIARNKAWREKNDAILAAREDARFGDTGWPELKPRKQD